MKCQCGISVTSLPDFSFWLCFACKLCQSYEQECRGLTPRQMVWCYSGIHSTGGWLPASEPESRGFDSDHRARILYDNREKITQLYSSWLASKVILGDYQCTTLPTERP